jgi:peptidoglycan/LPS O-acetylase OafA/YrhL
MTTKAVLSPEGPGRKFNASVHGLRGLSALLVYFFHVYDMSRKQGFFPAASWSIPLFKCCAHGVQIFFIISGFLITGSLINHASPRRFLIDRWIRIYPVFLTIHLLSFAVGPFIGYKLFSGISATSWIRLFAENALLLPGIFNLPLVQLSAWTLSYEAAFYIVAAIAYVVASHAGKSYVGVFLVLVSAASLLYYSQSIFFIVGVVIYYFHSRVVVKLPRSLSLPMLLVMLASITLTTEKPFLMYFAAVPGLLMFWSVVGGSCLLSQIAETRPIMYMGTISYSFYLWHEVVMFPLKSFFAKEAGSMNDASAVLCFGVLGFAGTIVVAHLSYKLLEVRVAKALKRRLNPTALVLPEGPEVAPSRKLPKPNDKPALAGSERREPIF